MAAVDAERVPQAAPWVPTTRPYWIPPFARTTGCNDIAPCVPPAGKGILRPDSGSRGQTAVSQLQPASARPEAANGPHHLNSSKHDGAFHSPPRSSDGPVNAADAFKFLYVQMRKLKEHAMAFHVDLLLDDHSVVRLAFSTRYTSFRVRQGRLVEVPLQ